MHACCEDAKMKQSFRLKMRPLLAGLQEVKQEGKQEAEQKNYERFCVKSWEDALQKMQAYIAGSSPQEDLEQAQQAAEGLLAADPNLELPQNRPVRERVREMFRENPDIFN